MPVANYWNLNKVYFIIALLIIIFFLIIYAVLTIKLQITISKETNTNCTNPIAIYFDKENRDRCLTEKITKKNETQSAEGSFKKKKTDVQENIRKLNKKMEDVDNYYAKLLNKDYPEVKNVEKEFYGLKDTYQTIIQKYEETTKSIENVKNSFENSIQETILFAVDVGNNLVNILKQNQFTPKWKDKRKKLVDAHDKIKKYLNNSYVKKYISPDVEKKIDNTPLSKNVRNGVKK